MLYDFYYWQMSKIFNFFQSFESKAFFDFTGPLSYIAKEDIANGPSIAAAAVDGTSLSNFPSFPDLSSHSLASLVEFKEINDITMDATIKVQYHMILEYFYYDYYLGEK